MNTRAAKPNIKLTISLLVSNRIGTIRKCLDSIKPLLLQLPSELIVVDTVGEEKSDGSLAIAREYTDHIVRFEWCNDFAAARNAGLKYAKGEWFLYLDDDEWFEDVTPILNFLKTDDGTYNSCLYDQRNYSDYTGNTYTDGTVCRMVRITNHTVFKNKIHEYLDKYTPIFQLDCFVHHYGYVYSSNAERFAHSKRNIEPLLEMLNENPKDLRTILQLCQEYFVIRDYQKAKELCEKTLQFCLKDSTTYVAQIVVYYIKILYKFNETEALLNAANTFLHHPNVTELAKATISLIVQSVDSPQLTEEKLLANIDTYFANCDMLLENPDKLIYQMINTMKMSVSDKNRTAMLQRAMQLCKALGNWDKAREYLQRYCLTGEKADMLLSACLSQSVDAAFALNELSSLCETLDPCLQKPKILIDFLRICELALAKMNAGKEKWDGIRVLSQLQFNHPRITAMKMLIAEHDNRTPELPALIEEYAALEMESTLANDVIALSYRNKVSLKPLAGRLFIETWEATIPLLLKEIPLVEHEALVSFLQIYFAPGSPEMLLLKVSIIFDALTELIKTEPTPAAFDAKFSSYVETNAAYYRLLSPEGFFSQDLCVYLTKPARAAYYLMQALKYRQEKRPELQVRSIRQALTLQGKLEELARYIAKDIQAQQIKTPLSPADEMRQLSSSIKNSVLTLIKSQQWVQAKALLDNLNSITPDDPELDALYAKLPDTF